MAQTVVRRLLDALHAALHARAGRLRLGARTPSRDVPAHESLPEDRLRLGDRPAAIWAGVDPDGLGFERDQGPHEPLRLE